MEESLSTWRAAIKAFQLPTWQSLPEFELYMDQVVTLTNQYLADLFPNETKALLTNSMVNNYVKQKTILAPVKKRYKREHLAQLMMLTVLKQVLTIPEISALFTLQTTNQTIAASYAQFATTLEANLQKIARWENSEVTVTPTGVMPPAESLVIDSAMLAFSAKLLTEFLLAQTVQNAKKA